MFCKIISIVALIFDPDLSLKILRLLKHIEDFK